MRIIPLIALFSILYLSSAVGLTLISLLGDTDAAFTAGQDDQTKRFWPTHDTWVSSVEGETDANLGGSKKLKTKGIQELSLLKFSLSSLRGRVIESATLHLRWHSGQPQRRLTVSTIASDWQEGTSSIYRPHRHSASFNWARQDEQPWAFPGSDLTSVIAGEGHTLWRFADCTAPDEAGWQTASVSPAAVAAQAAGLSYGFAVIDDVGSEYSRTNGQFRYHLLPNRFVHSRDAGKHKSPYLTVHLGPEDRQPPEAIGEIKADTANHRPGEAMLSWISPRDNGPAGTLGFEARFTAGESLGWANANVIPRYLIPLAAAPGESVTMRLRDVGTEPGQTVTVALRPIDAAGNAGPISQTTFTTEPLPKPLPLAPAIPAEWPVVRTTDAPLPNPAINAYVIDPLDKIYPVSGELIPRRPEQYRKANHLWSAEHSRVRLHAARNEFTAFQIVLPQPVPGLKATLRFDSDTADNTNAPRAQLFRFHHVRSHRGWLPDPLIPLKDTDDLHTPQQGVDGQAHVVLYAEVYTPHGCRPGAHTGKLLLTSPSGVRTIDIVLHVWRFTLPDYLSFVPQMNAYGLPGGPAERAHYRLAHEHRTCLNRLAYNWKGQVRAQHDPPWNGYQFRWDAYDMRFGALFDGTAFDDLPRSGVPVDAFYLPLNENWPMDLDRSFRGGYWADRTFEPGYRDELVRASRAFAEHLSERGWTDTFFEFYLNNKLFFKKDRWDTASAPWVFDEPVNTQDFWALRWYAGAFHEGVTPVRGRVKTAFRADISRPQWQRNLLDGLLDVNVVGGSFYRYSRMVLDRKKRFGEITYLYGSSNPIEASNVQPAAWCIDAWTLGLDGVIPWQTIGNPQSWSNADINALFYPGGRLGQSTPVPSVRLKAYRRGQQDVEYMTILAEVLKQPRWVVGQHVRTTLGIESQFDQADDQDAGLVTFDNVDPVSLWRLRAQIGATLDKLQPPAIRKWIELRNPARVPAQNPNHPAAAGPQ